ncbi:response regulator transcription factor [Ferroacidibacillus organovorans]|nr:response regulator transcription factor [Ferroacidibacillus organovorans]
MNDTRMIVPIRDVKVRREVVLPTSQETSRPGRILIVDDERGIQDFLLFGLRDEGFDVATASDGEEALQVLEIFRPHIVLLDIMLPGMDGFEVCRLMKERSRVSIIMLTAKEEVDDRVRGLSSGADDYVVKPFAFVELKARIEARLRGQFPELTSVHRIGKFEIDKVQRLIRYEGRALGLSRTEFSLLELLLEKPGVARSREEIMQCVWGQDFHGEDNILEVYIRYLRHKLNDTKRQLIRTVRGVGYRVEVQ